MIGLSVVVADSSRDRIKGLCDRQAVQIPTFLYPFAISAHRQLAFQMGLFFSESLPTDKWTGTQRHTITAQKTITNGLETGPLQMPEVWRQKRVNADLNDPGSTPPTKCGELFRIILVMVKLDKSII